MPAKMLKTAIYVLSICLLIGCSAKSKLYLDALEQKDGFIPAAPTDIEPIVRAPVIYGVHEMSGGEPPRLGNRIGAAATPGVKLSIKEGQINFDINSERFRVYVPSGYTDGKPFGLLVFIGGSPEPEIPPSWFEVFDQKQIIWISAFDAGDQQPTFRRIGLALEARKSAILNYNIDPKRVYISGVSGGGIACSTIVARFPEAFNGSIQIAGAGGFGIGYREFEGHKMSFKNESQASVSGLYTSGRYNILSRRVIKRLRAKNRFVIIIGRNDFFYQMTARAYFSMRYMGFETLYLEIPGLGHQMPSEKGQIVRALDYLDRTRNR